MSTSSLALSLGALNGQDRSRAAATGLFLPRNLLHLQRPSWRTFVVRARKLKKHERWWRNVDPNSIKNNPLEYLNPFKPLSVKPKPVVLPFEKPLADIEKKITDVRKMADEIGLDFTEQILSLEEKYSKARKRLYTRLTPIQRVQMSRHPQRPTTLDHILSITDKWVELHGDRAGYDDPAIVTGLGSINGKTYMFIGHQKGRNVKENIQRNFGMPTPHGYRKALRMMRYANHFGFPIVTLIDTPGAFADLKSEELGQGEAIAFNLREMFGLEVPIVSIVTGEGGSGGALAIGCANTMLMLENAVFYVASPEACGAIIWKSNQAAAKAARKLKLTAEALYKLKVADGIIPEPLGGAHTDPSWTSQQIKGAILKTMEELGKMDVKTLLEHRRLKFRKLGGFKIAESLDPVRTRNMKKRGASVSRSRAGITVDVEKTRKMVQEAKDGTVNPASLLQKLRDELQVDIADALTTMGLSKKLEQIIESSKSSLEPDLAGNPFKNDKMRSLVEEFWQQLNHPGVYRELKQKMGALHELGKLTERENFETVKTKLIDLEDQIKPKLKIWKEANDKLSQGQTLQESELVEFEAAKRDLKDVLRSAGCELDFGEKPDDNLPIMEALVEEEIEKLVKMGGVREKIDHMQKEIKAGASKERVQRLEKGIRADLAACLDKEWVNIEARLHKGLQTGANKEITPELEKKIRDEIVVRLDEVVKTAAGKEKTQELQKEIWDDMVSRLDMSVDNNGRLDNGFKTGASKERLQELEKEIRNDIVAHLDKDWVDIEAPLDGGPKSKVEKRF